MSAAARRVSVVSAPGISALQGAAARSGAILGHDFCAISLSDLLTPWDQIERRIHAAGAGDFVVAFYNPVSRRRRTQLAAAREEAAAERRLPSIRAKLRQLRLLPTHSTSSPPRLLAEARDQLLELPALRNEVDERQKALGEVTMRARRARDASLPSPSSLLPSHSPSPYPR